jgi:GMP synthase (glutamine-hydrolysing)
VSTDAPDRVVPLRPGNARPRLLVIQPDPLTVLDRFGEWLSDAEVVTDVVRPFAGDVVPEHLETDGLLVMGGRMSVWHDGDHPWLADVRRLLRHAVQADRPTLGICLGGQLLAQAFGGAVTTGDQGVEAGVIRVEWRPESRSDALFSGLPTPFPVGSLHGDAVARLPDAAVWLGRSAMYRYQAFRVGPSAWGVQFHPELAFSTYRAWIAGLAATNDAARQERLVGAVADFAELDEQVRLANRVVAERFANLLHARAGAVL